MQALVFDGAPTFLEKKKAQQPETTRVFGATLFADDIVRAFLRYGTAEKFYFYAREFYRDLSLPEPQSTETPRASVLTPAMLHDKLGRLDQVGLLTARPLPQNFVPIRKIFKKQWPIISVIHALSDIVTADLVCELLMQDLRENDAVVCSTKSGRAIIQKLIQGAVASLGGSAAVPLDVRARLPVIPIGVDCEAFDFDGLEARRLLDLAADEIVILCLGRMTPHAKADLGPLLLCFRELLSTTNKKLRLIIAGDDTRHGMAPHLREYARLLDCADSLTVIPNISAETKRLLYGASDIFVAPSDHLQETFGIALVEAMAAGLPVVASDWNGYREVIEHGQTGFLVPTYWVDLGGGLELVCTALNMEVRNSVLSGMTTVDQANLYRDLHSLVESSELRARMGEAGQRVALERYDWRIVIATYEKLYDELLRAGKRNQQPSSASSPFTYSAQEIFIHYPTRALSPDSSITITERGRKWLRAKFRLGTLPEEPAIDDLILERILRLLEPTRQPISIAEAAFLIKTDEGLVSYWIIARMLKYGLVGLTPLL